MNTGSLLALAGSEVKKVVIAFLSRVGRISREMRFRFLQEIN